MQLNELKYNDQGLIPIIVQNAENGQVIMFAYGTKETVQKSVETKQAHYWSRSRNKIWMKGEESGNTQRLVDIFYDCDADVLLYIVDQKGVACHTNNKSCFYRNLDGHDQLSPDFRGNSMIDDVFEVIEDRKHNPKEGSYVGGLFKKGIDKIIKKVGEEAGEVIIAAKNKDRDELIYEITDLWFHTLITMAYFDIKPDAIDKELNKRFGKSKKEYGRD